MASICPEVFDIGPLSWFSTTTFRCSQRVERYAISVALEVSKFVSVQQRNMWLRPFLVGFLIATIGDIGRKVVSEPLAITVEPNGDVDLSSIPPHRPAAETLASTQAILMRGNVGNSSNVSTDKTRTSGVHEKSTHIGTGVNILWSKL